MALVMSGFYCVLRVLHSSLFFFFNDTATTEIYTLSLHDALPISTMSARSGRRSSASSRSSSGRPRRSKGALHMDTDRSEEHTSELQSRLHLVCRLLLEKKKYARAMGVWHGFRYGCSPVWRGYAAA